MNYFTLTPIKKEQIIELATKRKTTRIFSKAQIDIKDVLYCIRVAVQAPSGANSQPWRFICVDDPLMKEKVRLSCEMQEKRFHETVDASLKKWFNSKGITFKKSFLTDAPLLLAVFSDQRMPYATESTWLAIGYILLSLEERCLSTLTYTPSYPEKIEGVFDVPKDFKLEAILPIGYSSDSKPKEERNLFSSFIYSNFWGETSKKYK